MNEIKVIRFHYDALEQVGRRLRQLKRKIILAKGISDTFIVKVWYCC
jgi:hypothetical protein